MRKFVIVGVTVAVLLMVLAVPALAKASKSSLYVSDAYTCNGGAGDTTTPLNKSFVVINVTRKGMLQIEVSLKRAMPNTTYSIWVNQDLGGCPTTAQTRLLKTNNRGNGNAHFQVPMVEGATHFWVSAVSADETQVLRSLAVP